MICFMTVASFLPSNRGGLNKRSGATQLQTCCSRTRKASHESDFFGYLLGGTFYFFDFFVFSFVVLTSKRIERAFWVLELVFFLEAFLIANMEVHIGTSFRLLRFCRPFDFSLRESAARFPTARRLRRAAACGWEALPCLIFAGANAMTE